MCQRPETGPQISHQSNDKSTSPSSTAPVTNDNMKKEEDNLTETTKKLQWLLGTNYGDKPLLQRLNYFHLTLIAITPIIALYGILTTSINRYTMIWAIVYYFITGMGITAGYHRLFAHKAYDANIVVKMLLLFAGAGAVEGSARWWARDHRAHHRYVDTPKDPYSFKNGFWYAHIGWMLVKQDKNRIGKAECDDLYEDPLITWQHKNYLPISLFFAFVFPSLVAGLLWGDYRGGYYIAGVVRLVFLQQSTFSINSLAHYAGESTYSDKHTAKNSIITAIVTFGEGYHNFHHEFPSDYRNGVRWYQYDPTKILIRLLSLFGMTYNLKTFPMNEIEKGALQMKKKAVESEMSKLNWGPDATSIPTMTMTDFLNKVKVDGRKLIILDGFVLDVEKFLDEHPGGTKILKIYIGKDVSGTFETVYRHSNAAHNLQATYRIAKIVD